MANLLYDWNANSGTILTISFVLVCVMALGANRFIDAQQSNVAPQVVKSARKNNTSNYDSTDERLTPGTSKVTVTVTGFDSDRGQARIAAYTSAEDFRTRSKAFATSEQPIVDGKIVWTVDLPTDSSVAIAAFHDVDDNDELSYGAFGIPSELYGFSNDARGMTGPPSYERASVRFSSPEEQIEFVVK